MRTLTLYSRPQCHLCELLLEELRPLLDATTRVEIVDISEDAELNRRYGLRIPVLSFAGEDVSGYPLDQSRLQQILAADIT